MALSIYNSFSRKKEEFKPINDAHVGMYVCGPTVSGESHLGHGRTYITFDVVYRYLVHLGYKVRYVRNITDAGHFEEEGREAEDKISKKAVLEKVEPMELVQKYTNLFHWAMKEFNNIEPSIEPTATGHIVEQINMIQKILKEGFAYVSNRSVYFDVKKYAASYDYGKLSGRVIDEMLETTRELDGQEEKRDKADFALWKAAPPQHIMRWNSPWGEGFPGWHIECSAMATKYLGTEFDIHGGGMDLKFPHHESEIAQSTICNHTKPVKYWMHSNMITVGGKKMGKSYHNDIKLTELFTGKHHLLSQAFTPMTIRFFILQSHYRSTLDFTSDALVAAEKGLKRLWDAYLILNKIASENFPFHVLEISESTPDKKVNQLIGELEEFINDDFSTAKVLANLFEIVPVINALKDGIIKTSEISATTISLMKSSFKTYLEDIFGLKDESKTNTTTEGILQLLIEIRKTAKNNKDFVTSDKIRKELNNLGILLKDNKDGSIDWSKS